MASFNDNAPLLLRQKWLNLTEGIERDVVESWWNVIEEELSKPSRKYHTFSHLQSMFCHMESVSNEIDDKRAVSYAIFFHDLVYDPQKQDNEEQSIELFRKFAQESGLGEDTDLMNKVIEMIAASQAHCTEVHKEEGSYGNDDVHYFLDFDMSILGSEPKEYEKYAAQISEEYSFLPSFKYDFLRSKVLKLFLQIPNIYATRLFREKYERQARENLQNEIDRLSSKATAV
ncbi:uncharacterized protein LOC129217718 [Uloborus diversus]|uniref:uncharacterized protein LOC129217718 n=1 Tax=Uloborus diversus TaxID=327109 RepID=UPI00240A8D40|nr:uncharacterized protein LOC129217718 [Uloborus diversus]